MEKLLKAKEIKYFWMIPKKVGITKVKWIMITNLKTTEADFKTLKEMMKMIIINRIQNKKTNNR